VNRCQPFLLLVFTEIDVDITQHSDRPIPIAHYEYPVRQSDPYRLQYKITLRLLALMPRFISTCKICRVIKLISVTASKLVKAPSVTSQYFLKYPSACQRSRIMSRLSKALFQLAVIFVTDASVAPIASLVTGFSVSSPALVVLKSVELFHHTHEANMLPYTAISMTPLV
jgi:hypothetical protein